MTKAMMRRITAAIVPAMIVYQRKIRDPILTCGATAEEAEARLPGDELLENADGCCPIGAGLTRDGTQDAAGNQGARGAPSD